MRKRTKQCRTTVGSHLLRAGVAALSLLALSARADGPDRSQAKPPGPFDDIRIPEPPKARPSPKLFEDIKIPDPPRPITPFPGDGLGGKGNDRSDEGFDGWRLQFGWRVRTIHLGRSSDSLDHFGDAIGIGDDPALAYAWGANANVQPGDRQRDLIEAERQVTRAPKDHRSHINRARIRHRVGDLQGALRDAEQALALRPHDPDILFLHALILAEGDEFARAIADLDRVVAARPEDPWGYAYRGWARSWAYDDEKALPDLDRAIASGKAAAWVYQLRGIIHRHRGDLDRAIADLSQSIALDGSPDSYCERALAHRDGGDLEGALADVEQAIEGDRGCADAYRIHALIRGKKGDFKQALTDYDNLEALRPGCWVTDAGRVVVRWNQGSLDDALADLDRAIRRCPTPSALYSARAVLRAENEDYRLALADLGRFALSRVGQWPPFPSLRVDLKAKRVSVGLLFLERRSGKRVPPCTCIAREAGRLDSDLRRSFVDPLASFARTPGDHPRFTAGRDYLPKAGRPVAKDDAVIRAAAPVGSSPGASVLDALRTVRP